MRNIPEILNWRRINDKISLSGQPTENQLSKIRDLGVTHIINLGPHSNKGALADEAGTVAALGMEYIYIPVDFENPTRDDFDAFCAALEQLEDQPVHVHCIYNARVTAFFYRHAQSGRSLSKEAAFELMDGIWRPGGVWAAFIGDAQSVHLPNRYSGDDY
ncbi:protein tyrosine phosphatase family protein [uncultured Roseobacter sp.]|uniref:protein tyrosine phosphatase family protein n=1 Tax=uncultured Roseobacter sp. TaxID=114847 RepID=UPI002638AB77|nr:protein tyrosine phosphatase family protein [uncultured Roseobacter sp.]